MALLGRGTLSFKIKSELIAGTENKIVSLTNKLNIFQYISTRSISNIRIKSLKVNYRPRLGLRGKGTIHARVIDNRIDADISDQTIHHMTFDAGSSANLTWSSSMWFAKSDLSRDEPPILLELELTECNMTAGYSVGQIVVLVELTGADSIEKFLYRAPTAVIKDDPIAANAGLTKSASFSTKDMRRIMVAAESPEEENEQSRLRRVAKETIGSLSARAIKYRASRSVRG